MIFLTITIILIELKFKVILDIKNFYLNMLMLVFHFLLIIKQYFFLIIIQFMVI